MKKNSIFIAAATLVGFANAQPGEWTMPDVPAAIPSPLAVTLDFSEGTTGPVPESGVEVIRGVVYVERDGRELHMDIFYPQTASGPLPCIVYVPGSAWMQQNLDMSVPNLTRLAARGYVVASVEYRPSNVGQFPAQVQDAKTAVRFMRKHADRYRVDVNNVFAWGDSSGGHTALLVGTTAGIPELDTPIYGEFSARVNAVVDYFGPSDLEAIAAIPNMLNQNPDTSPEAMLIGGRIADNPRAARRASPVHYITPATPPVLVAHGDKDFLVPMSQSNLVAEALERVGAEYEYYCLLGGNHGSREFWTDGMLDVVERFLQRHLKK